MKKIAKFLGKDYSDEFYQQVVDACQIDKMRTKKVETAPEDVKALSPEGYTIYYREGRQESDPFHNYSTVHLNRYGPLSPL